MRYPWQGCLSPPEREKNPGSKVALLTGKFWAIQNFFCIIRWNNNIILVCNEIFSNTRWTFFSNSECFCGIWLKTNIHINFKKKNYPDKRWKFPDKWQKFLEIWKFSKPMLETCGHTVETLSNMEFFCVKKKKYCKIKVSGYILEVPGLKKLVPISKFSNICLKSTDTRNYFWNNLEILCHRIKIAWSLCTIQISGHMLDISTHAKNVKQSGNFCVIWEINDIIFMYNEKFPDQSQKFPNTG